MFEDKPKYKVGEKAFHIEILHYTIREGIITKVSHRKNGKFYYLKGKDLNAFYHENFVSNDIKELLKRYIKENTKQAGYHRQMMYLYNQEADKLTEILAKYEPDIYLKGIQ